jgi:hypothetical protein
MTVLESFVKFAEALPPDRREVIDEVLADLMGAHTADDDFTPEEIAEIERRLAEPMIMADPAEVEKLLGRPLPRR